MHSVKLWRLAPIKSHILILRSRTSISSQNYQFSKRSGPRYTYIHITSICLDFQRHQRQCLYWKSSLHRQGTDAKGCTFKGKNFFFTITLTIAADHFAKKLVDVKKIKNHHFGELSSLHRRGVRFLGSSTPPHCGASLLRSSTFGAAWAASFPPFFMTHVHFGFFKASI